MPSTKPDPYVLLRQRAWDDAAALAAAGADSGETTTRVLRDLGPDIEDECRRAVPPRGRVFWSSLVKSLLWAVAVDVLLLSFGPNGTSAPLLRPLLLVVVVIWAVAFGVFAANHKVKSRRVQHAEVVRGIVSRLAGEAAVRVHASTRPPVLVTAADRRDWCERVGLTPGRVRLLVGDGSGPGLRAALDSEQPVVGFMPEPGVFTDAARAAADECGVALFVVAGKRMLPMSAVASAVSADPDAAQRLVQSKWAAAAPARASRSH